ncbi:MAG TPA: hypothetical protein VN685_02220 [Rhizomicrobium sp.]|nr:hypothetical protein [Rhizomicrobium sp.]
MRELLLAIAVISVLGLRSSWAADDSCAQRGAFGQCIVATEKNRPTCTTVRFTGPVAGAAAYLSQFEKLTREMSKPGVEPAIEDYLARNPIGCSFTRDGEATSCKGIDFLQNQPGFIIAWSADRFTVMTPIDFESGRKDAPLIIERKDAQCRDQSPPGNDFSDNMGSFWKQFEKLGHAPYN